jgi:hypothetical protein
MKKIFFVALVTYPCALFAQFGVKAGVNFANVTNAASINSSARSGFHVGILLAPPSKGVISSRTEFIFSRQGYNYSTSTNTGNVDLNYIMLPQYMCINITKYLQIQLGGQMGFLINAKADSTKSSSNPSNPYGDMMDYYNRFDYGYGGGVEVHPFKGLLVGARINISLSSLYKDYDPQSGSGTPPSFVPKVNVKNNLFQIFAGWKIGKLK